MVRFAGWVVNLTATGLPAWAGTRSLACMRVALMLLAGCATLPVYAQQAEQQAAPPELSEMNAQGQADWLSHAASDGRLEALDDAQLVSLFKAVSGDGLAAYVREGVGHLDEYGFEMWRQERIKEHWNERPEHLQVRYRQSPMQIYAKWLSDGPHKGQEVLYDETRRPDQMFGHLGGLLRALSFWISLDGPMAHTESNHSLRDIGLQYVAQSFEAELTKFEAAGVHAPSEVDVEMQHGTRLVVFSWESPTGRPAFYAKRERVGIDLRHPWIRLVESFDNDGQPFEKIFYDKVVPQRFDDLAFDPKNPDYRF
jgi:Protein of unknown function (DUF1571)